MSGSLLPPLLSQVDGFQHGAGFIQSFLILQVGIRIRDNAGTGIDENFFSLHDDGPNNDAGVKITVVSEVPMAPAYSPRFSGSNSLIICMARIFGAPETVPAGNADTKRSNGVFSARQFSADVGDDVNNMGIALDSHQFVNFNRAYFGDPANVVAAQVYEHDMLGTSLGSAKRSASTPFFIRRGASSTGAGDGTELDGVAGQPDHGFR